MEHLDRPGQRKSNTVVLTTLFPLSVNFFDDFLNSLILQTDKDFDLLVVNDGVKNLIDFVERYKKINFIEIISESSIVKNRELGIKTAIELNYEYLIFGDSDDYFETNRVEVSKKFLEKYDIVVNDLTLFDDYGIYKESYYASRLNDLIEIDTNFIRDKNIFGLSNTAIQINTIKTLDFCENLIALDWYFFSTLLSENRTAIYTSQTQTFYRQHKHNTIGLGRTSLDSIKNSLEVKKIHYQCLSKRNRSFNNYLSEVVYLQENIENIDFKIDVNNKTNLLWWETPKYIINNKKKKI
ncbi:glycosyltransferase [Polaribacter dokdonensis]|uniref:Glycosyl transferase family 2 n=1 Tax=Polaribacter dokdonensis DSW-5 TaxID=1300348 RepID=A0A0N0UN65_9FLAO|nr:glycosyltransferase [Polaribacter dokdonensis]KOY50668.1 Glycosyl transferase family 2 [Polaribacter dokdonensis DSW-5]SEE62493.1 Glycosyl transferase family 2 [Polaribacter dokdonensis DSW-5]